MSNYFYLPLCFTYWVCSRIHRTLLSSAYSRPGKKQIPLIVIGSLKCGGSGKTSFTIELANGHYNYLPTPRQHRLGGYETWMGTNILEVNASRSITQVLLQLLDEVSAGE